jgi:hypothetical protein
MKKLLWAGSAAAALAVVAGAVTFGGGPRGAVASSHREAPLVAEDPSADNTDLYAFRSKDAPDMLTVISNWIPGEDPAAGPNYYTFSQTARYNIYVDRDGDGKADVTYRFRFKTEAPQGDLFLGNTVQTYTVTRETQGRSEVVALGTTPPDNIGPRSTPNYANIADAAVFPVAGGGKVFAGQREDAFFGDIGAIFDLVAIRKGLGNMGGGRDFFAGYGVHAIALQIPIAQIDTPNHVVGVWSGTDRPAVTTRHAHASDANATAAGDNWVQVSRLGNPLVNEVIIPTRLKDEWNGDDPSDDSEYVGFFQKPVLAAVINHLYPGVVNAPESGRDDLVSVLLTGVPGLNYTGPTLADELRINLSTPPRAQGDPGFSRLGVLGGDAAGYPNGRRLEDDVIDIAEEAVAGFLKGNVVPLGDGVDANDVANLPRFPYEAAPFSGFADTKGEQKP